MSGTQGKTPALALTALVRLVSATIDGGCASRESVITSTPAARAFGGVTLPRGRSCCCETPTCERRRAACWRGSCRSCAPPRTSAGRR